MAKSSAMRRLLVCCALALAAGKVKPNPEFQGEVPTRTKLDTAKCSSSDGCSNSELRNAIRFVMTELKRMSNQYRYATFTKCHGAEAGPANFDGRNLFLDIEFDMLNGKQPTRHDIIVFKDENDVVTGMAIDEFPEVRYRELPDPDVD